MQYATNVLPILQAYCYSCHGNGSTAGSGGISLDGYANLQKWAANGILVGNITHASGFVAMPFGQPKLSDCDINKIIDWVNRGIQNN
jgi:mono/diheme cytochrome c family protein